MSGGPFVVDPTGLFWALGEDPPVTPEQPETSSCAWLLDLQIGGRVLRYSTRSLAVFDARGLRYLYRSGLEDFELEVDGYQESQGFQLTDRRVFWAGLAAAGENLERATATLRHWEPGELLERARVVLAGEVTEPEFASPEAPSLFVGTLKAGEEVDRTWPSPQATVNLSTWDRDLSAQAYDDGIDGAVYPTVFGYPGEGDEEADPPVPCMPVPLAKWVQGAVSVSYLLIGQGTLDCVGGQVYVRDTVGRNELGFAWDQEWLNVVTDTDKLGQTVTMVEVPAGDGGVDAELGHEYYVGFSRASGKGGGTRKPDHSGPIETLADVARFCLQYSGRPFDLEAQEAERPFLDPFRIDGTLNEEVQLVPWFETHLLPLFPLARARTGRGMYWRYLNWWATETDAKAHLDADAHQVTRASSIRTPQDQIANHFSIEFQQVMGRTGSRRTLTSEAGKVLPWFERPGTPLDDRILGSPACALSQNIYKIREAKLIRSPFLWSERTAVSVLQHLAVRDTFPRRPVLYRGRGAQLRTLVRGDIVTVTDSDAALSRAVAMVDGIRLSARNECEVALSLLDPRRLG